MTSHLYLIRAAESIGSVLLEQTDVQESLEYAKQKLQHEPSERWILSEQGKRQLETASPRIRSYIGSAHVFFVSPFVRALQTAAALFPSTRWFIRDELIERNMGQFHGFTQRMIEEAMPTEGRQRQSNPFLWTPPGGESIFSMLTNRVRPFLISLIPFMASDQQIVVVTHNETMWAFRAALEGMNMHDFNRIQTHPSNNHHANHLSLIHYEIRMNEGSHATMALPKEVLVRYLHSTTDDQPAGPPIPKFHVKYTTDELLEYARVALET